MAEINLLDGSPESKALLVELLQALAQEIPGPFSDDTEADAGGVAIGEIYNQLGPLALRMS
jgi:hypothetical protein